MTNKSSLIQWLDGMELPASGIWSLHRGSHITLSSDGRRRLDVVTGAVLIPDTPERSSLTIVAGSADRRLHLTASVLEINSDANGFSFWQLGGTVVDGIDRHPVDVSLSYRGVHGRRDQAWAWFTGRASTAAEKRFSLKPRHELALQFDMLFAAPDADVAVRGAVDRSHPTRAA